MLALPLSFGINCLGDICILLDDLSRRRFYRGEKCREEVRDRFVLVPSYALSQATLDKLLCSLLSNSFV